MHFHGCVLSICPTPHLQLITVALRPEDREGVRCMKWQEINMGCGGYCQVMLICSYRHKHPLSGRDHTWHRG